MAGPTAVGKTDVAINLAQEFHTEIISADARQLYKEMEIGTAKPSAIQLQQVPHHFINHISIHNKYSVGQYEAEVIPLLEKLFAQHDIVFLVGGSGLYIDAVLHGLDKLPASDAQIRQQVMDDYKNNGLQFLQEFILKNDPDYFAVADIQNPQRLMRAMEVFLISGKPYSEFRKKNTVPRNFTSIPICLNIEREKLYAQINQRVNNMMLQGLLHEAEQLFPYRQLNALQTVGYKELFAYFENACTLQEAADAIKQNTRNYAKRQLTWFRKDNNYTWFDPADTNAIALYIENTLQ